MGRNPKIIAESGLNQGVKFIALESSQNLTMLKFTAAGLGDPQCVARLDDYLAELNQLIENNALGEDEIFLKEALLTDEGELIKIGARINEGVGHITV